MISVTDANGAAITDSTHIANVNPLRYRGYYFDSETGFSMYPAVITILRSGGLLMLTDIFSQALDLMVAICFCLAIIILIFIAISMGYSLLQ